MPRYMVMLIEDEAASAALTSAETLALAEGHAAYERELRASAAYLDGERLRPSAEGRRVAARDGVPRTDAGPFGDEALSAYYVLAADDLDAAVALARRCPLPPGASLDVRPLMKGRIQPDKASQRGRVFACAVLGRAPSERAWVDVMDRIDASTSERFPPERFLGGVRLEEPGRSRRLTSAGGRRAALDGPFLEGKEVIGGLFFLRMASVDEAAAWAASSAFMEHGTVEIRELWRS